MYKIIDWAGNHLFKNETFKTYEDGWNFIYIKFPNEEDLGDYYVVEI